MTRRGRGEGTVSRRRDGRWVAIVGHGYSDAGKRIRQSVYGRTREEVVAKLQPALRARDDGLPVTSARLTVGSYLTDWLASAKSTVRPSTFDSYRSLVDQHLLPTIGRVKLVALTPAAVEAMLRVKSASGLSPRRVAMIRAILRLALGRAVKHGLVVRNVAALASGPRQEHHEIQPLSPDEIRTLLAAVRGHRLEGLVVTAVTTGMRSGELRGLAWADVNLEAGSLTVRHALAKVDGAWALVPPKSSTSRRTIALPSMTVEALRAHRTRQLEERLAAGPEWFGKWDLVFPSSAGTPADPSDVLRTFHRVLRDAGLPRRRFHDLRHSAATALLVSGVSPRVVQSILGHSQVSLTLGTYSHAIAELQTDAAERMDALLAAR